MSADAARPDAQGPRPPPALAPQDAAVPAGRARARLVRMALLAVLLAALAHAGVGALRNAAADRIAQPARDRLAAWSGAQPIAPDAVAWKGAYDALRRARAIAPHDPDLALDLGLLLRVRAQSSARVPALAETLLVEALEAFRDAVRLRPVSPFAWANIAYAQHLRLHSGTLALAAQARAAAEGERARALERALRYGSNEPAIRRIVRQIASPPARIIAAPGGPPAR